MLFRFEISIIIELFNVKPLLNKLWPECTFLPHLTIGQSYLKLESLSRGYENDQDEYQYSRVFKICYAGNLDI